MLHLGHVWDSYYIDMLIRYKQISGYKAIWYSGIMDNANRVNQNLVPQYLFMNLFPHILDSNGNIITSGSLQIVADWITLLGIVAVWFVYLALITKYSKY